MNFKRFQPIIQGIAVVAISSLAVWGVAEAAGTLTAPSGTPAAESYTLDDIYTKLTTDANATSGNHSLSTTTAPAVTMHSLADIYGAIPTIDATKVLSGTTYLGVAGTASAGASLSNMWNGTGQGITGGNAANGGVDDDNAFGTPPSNRFSATWTACTSANSYCGSGDSGAQAKDGTSGLIWSLPCDGSACSSFSTSSPGTYSWDNSGGSNGSDTASQLCSAHTGWVLPDQKQLLQAYIDGSYGNLEADGNNYQYWSATLQSDRTNDAWFTALSSGYTDNSGTNNSHYLRCVFLGSR